MVLHVEMLEYDCVRIRMSDNGKGLPTRPPATAPGSGMGLRLIDGLAQQTDAKLDWMSSSDGTMLCLEFLRQD